MRLAGVEGASRCRQDVVNIGVGRTLGDVVSFALSTVRCNFYCPQSSQMDLSLGQVRRDEEPQK
jgi:hypothetical protein